MFQFDRNFLLNSEFILTKVLTVNEIFGHMKIKTKFQDFVKCKIDSKLKRFAPNTIRLCFDINHILLILIQLSKNDR